MGYRSQVALVAGFKNKEQFDEVWAVYLMDTRVQAHNLADDWKQASSKGHPVLYFESGASKWYDGYEDVSGMEYLGELMQTFHEERGFPFVFHKTRIGEDTADIEEEDTYENDDDTDMMEIIYSSVAVECSVSVNF